MVLSYFWGISKVLQKEKQNPYWIALLSFCPSVITDQDHVDYQFISNIYGSSEHRKAIILYATQ